MIEYEESAGPIVRAGELELAGRRIAARAVPYSGEAGRAALRFDPVERRLVLPRPSGRVLVGPADPGAWSRALARSPAGPVLVGPGSPAEEIRGSFRAAAEGVREAGRPAYLLDPTPEGLPGEPDGTFVSLFAWAPEEGEDGAAILASVRHGIPSGGLLPIVAGWTNDPAFLDGYLGRLAAAGARFAAPSIPADDGEARRLFVEARARVEPSSADRFFETIHHSDRAASVREGLRRFRDAALRRGLTTIPPRPRGAAEPAGNWAAAARLEEMAQAVEERDEHRAALLYAAARWIDESARDLVAVVREGNFRKVFPFAPEIAREAESAFGSPP